jgi:hypothetical protein
MPRLIPVETDEVLDLGDVVEMINTGDFEPRDEDNFASWGNALKKLANNRTFLTDLVIDELKDRSGDRARDNQYSSQVILFYSRPGKFIMRANFWPGLQDSVVHNSGTNPFFYGMPHDHNFSFLTVGYVGPGYWSEYYEYDYEQVAGYTGEKVDLRFIEKSKLDLGKVMLYRAHKDVHNQLPADEMSISLNILETSYDVGMRDQYGFDLEKQEIGRIMTRTSLEPLLALSAHFGGEKGAELLESFAARHPSDRVRFKALQARAGSLSNIDDRIALYEGAARSHNRFVSTMAALEAERLAGGRAWIENAPGSQAGDRPARE